MSGLSPIRDSSSVFLEELIRLVPTVVGCAQSGSAVLKGVMTEELPTETVFPLRYVSVHIYLLLSGHGWGLLMMSGVLPFR